MESEIRKGENIKKTMGTAIAMPFSRALPSPVASSLKFGKPPLAKTTTNAMMLACNTSNTTISPDKVALAVAIRQ
jgi:hypothetical protein